MASDAKRLRTYEEDFREAGLPLFSEDISAAEDIWNCEEFLDELTSEMRKSFEERAQYLKLRENQASG